MIGLVCVLRPERLVRYEKTDCLGSAYVAVCSSGVDYSGDEAGFYSREFRY